MREARLVGREGELGPWERQWHEAEDWYFGHRVSASDFDVIVDDPEERAEP